MDRRIFVRGLSFDSLVAIMRTILCSLIFFTAMCNAEFEEHANEAVGRALRSLSTKLPHSHSVPYLHFADIDPFVCKQTGYFPDIGNCRFYYHCVYFMPGHLTRYVYECDRGLIYSIRDENCVPPIDSDRPKCRGKQPRPAGQMQADKEKIREESEIAQSSNEDSVNGLNAMQKDVENTERTTDYFTGSTFASSNHTGLENDDSVWVSTVSWSFSTEQQRNNSLSIVNETTTTTIRQPSRRSECIGEGFFADLDDCSKFYRCVLFVNKYISYRFACPRGTIWDDRRKTCNFRAAVGRINCKDKRHDYLSLSTEQRKFLYPLGISRIRAALVCPTGFRQHPNYCNVFYQCTADDNLKYRVKTFVCPEGSVFDEGNVRCTKYRAAWRNSCTNFRLASKSLPIIQKLSEHSLCPMEGRFPAEEDACSRTYFECRRNELGSLEGYLFQCPGDQIFSPSTNRCVQLPRDHFCPRNPANL